MVVGSDDGRARARVAEAGGAPAAGPSRCSVCPGWPVGVLGQIGSCGQGADGATVAGGSLAFANSLRAAITMSGYLPGSLARKPLSLRGDPDAIRVKSLPEHARESAEPRKVVGWPLSCEKGE